MSPRAILAAGWRFGEGPFRNAVVADDTSRCEHGFRRLRTGKNTSAAPRGSNVHLDRN